MVDYSSALQGDARSVCCKIDLIYFGGRHEERELERSGSNSTKNATISSRSSICVHG